MEVRIILLAVIIYFVVRFVNRFVMPILRITRMTQHQMNDMRQKMNNMEHQQQNRSSKRVEGDYIEYEEVK